MPDWMVTLAVGLIAAGPGIYAIIAGRHKARAESAQIVTETAMKLLPPLEARIGLLEAKVAKLETENDALEEQVREFRAIVREFRELVAALWEGIVILSNQLDCNGLSPNWDMAQYQRRVEKVLGIAQQ